MPYNEKQQRIAGEALASIRTKAAAQLELERSSRQAHFDSEGLKAEALTAIEEIINAYDDEVSFTAADVVGGFDPGYRSEAARILARLRNATDGNADHRQLMNISGARYVWLPAD